MFTKIASPVVGPVDLVISRLIIAAVFLAPIFNTKKKNSFLDISKFNLISRSTDIKIVALGGINSTNYKKLKAIKCYGFAAINWIKKNRPKKIGRF